MPGPISLLCLPWAGSSATVYLRWRRLLPSWVRVLPIELPGRGSRMAETPIEDFDLLVAQLCAEHADTMRGAFAFFGHSMGALLAHGMAQRQRLLGRPQPLLLVASGSPAPSRRATRTFPAKGDEQGLIADLRRQAGTPEEIFHTPELLRMTLDVLGADYRVCESFVHRPVEPLMMPVHALGGRADDISEEQLLAWADEAGGGFSAEWFDGGHFFVQQQEARVIAALTRHLEQVTAIARRRPGAFA